MTARFSPESWHEHAAAMRRLARGLLGDEELGEEVVQSAFAAALEEPRAVTRGWMLRAVRQRAIDFLRRNRRPGLHEQLPPERTSPGAGEIAERLESHRVLVECLAELGGSYREAVYLRYFEGRTPSEIARDSGVPVKTVKTRLRRALQELRERLERRFEGGARGWQAVIVAPLLGRAPAPIAPIATGSPVGVGTTAAAAGVAAGGIGIMAKNIALVAVLALLIFGITRTSLFTNEAARPASAEAVAAEPPDVAAPAQRPALAQQPESAPGRAAVETTATEAPPPAPTTGSLLVRVTWHDATPAAGIALEVSRSGIGLPASALAWARSDEHGLAQIEALAPGAVEVGPARFSQAARVRADVVAGSATEVTVTIQAGVAVEGVVRDAGGKPVPGADVWIASGSSEWPGGEVAAQSDAFGRFSLRDVDKATSLGALASGFAPSALVDLDLVDTSSGTVQIELVVARAGGGVRGRVVTASGAPVAGAWIGIGKPGRFAEWRSTGNGFVEAWAPRAAQTDAQGNFHVAVLDEGKHPVAARAAGLAEWKGEVEVQAGATTELEIVLASGFSVAGIVRDASGAPLPGAVVRAFDGPLDESFVQVGQFDWTSTFGYPLVQADAAGRYELHCLPAGEAHLYASPRPPERYTHDRGAKMRAHTVLRAADGEALEWNPVIEEGHVLAGRVTYSDGVPLPEHFVMARNTRTGRSQSLTTDAEGRFRFLNMELAPHVVGVQLWHKPPGALPLEAADVWPDGEELLLVASFPAPFEQAPAKVTGRIDDAAGRLAHAGALRAVLESDQRSWNFGELAEEGRFEFGDVEPGRYKVIAFSNDEVILDSGWFDLAASEQRDLGALVTRPAGSVVIELARDATIAETEFTLYLRPEESVHARKVAVGSEERVLVPNLNPGRYSINAFGQGLAHLPTVFEIVEGVEAHVKLELFGAVTCSFELSWPQEKALGWLRTVVVDSAGRTYMDVTENNTSAITAPYRRTVRLTLGRYTLRVETLAGLAGSREFQIESLAADPPALVLALQ